jgi:predicted dehydrogenase
MIPWRVAILGCRARGTAAARGYATHPRTEVVGLCDLVRGRVDSLGDELGVSARFTDLDQMMEAVRPDLVAVPTGTEWHFDLGIRVLGYGAHLDVEKPICVDLEQADALLARAEAQGVRVAVHHQHRSGASMRAVWRAIADGRIGAPRYLVASGKGYYGGYGLMNLGTHLINAIISIAGHCRSLVAVAATDGHPITPEDVVPSPGGMGTIAGERITATLAFDGDVTATLLHHRFPRVESTPIGIVVHGAEGRLWSRSTGAWWQPTPHGQPEDGPWQPLPLELPPGFDASRVSEADEWSYVDEYVRALDEGRDHPCSGAEARHALEVMMGIFESAAYGVRVELPQARRDHPLLRWRREAGLEPPPPVPREYSAWLAAEDERLGRV